MLLTRRRESGAAAIRGYRRKLQTRLKLSRSYSWNYEPGLVVYYFVTNQLFGCEFEEKLRGQLRADIGRKYIYIFFFVFNLFEILKTREKKKTSSVDPSRSFFLRIHFFSSPPSPRAPSLAPPPPFPFFVVCTFRETQIEVQM